MTMGCQCSTDYEMGLRRSPASARQVKDAAKPD